jgi:hypothetical protein
MNVLTTVIAQPTMAAQKYPKMPTKNLTVRRICLIQYVPLMNQQNPLKLLFGYVSALY